MVQVDADVVDEIVAWCQGMNLPAIPFLSISWHETGGPNGGLRRSVEGTNPDGTPYRTFLGGDVALRRDGTHGPQSFGPFHIYSEVHGPFTGQVDEDGHRIPDYRAAVIKWDGVRTSMDYLWGNRWAHWWNRSGGHATFAADPVAWLFHHAKDMQGSRRWSMEQAEAAHGAGVDAYNEWLDRTFVPPPSDTRITVDELIAGLTLAAQGLEDLKKYADAQIQSIWEVVNRARDGVKA